MLHGQLKGLRYANRFPIGLEGVISKGSAADVRAFFSKWYRPEHMTVICIGDFDADSVVSDLQSLFRAPGPGGPLPVSFLVFVRQRNSLT